MGAFLSKLTSSSVIAITLAPFGIFFRKESSMKFMRNVNHEKIHWKQQMEMFIIFFYIWYGIEYFIRLFGTGNAYRAISFEQEAYDNEQCARYLLKRKPYAWLKYIFKACK